MSAIITVVIPVYNGEKYVHRAVESVVNQPVKEAAEVLIVNDGSTDQSGKACDLLAQEYPNVHVIHKENGGVSSARNLGIQNVTTKYIAFLDCDDWWEPGFLDQSMIDEFSSADSADVYQFAYQTINNNCSLVLQHPVLEETLLFSQPGLGRYDWNHHCSFVFSHELLKKHFVLYPIAKVGEDGSFLDMALVHAKRLKKRNKTIFSYWENMNSCLHTTNILTDTKERYKAFLQEQSYLKQYQIDLDAECTFLWTIANNLSRICVENDFQTVADFMNNECFPLLDRRPDIFFRKELMSQFKQWRTNAKWYWIKHKIFLGLPLGLKRVCYTIPVISCIFNYVYNRFYRKFIPYKKS